MTTAEEDPPAISAPVAQKAVSFDPSSAKLLELERKLAAKDGVMNEGVLATLQQYVASGGKPAAAIELLSENYRGYAQMTSLVCGWLAATEEGDGVGGGGKSKRASIGRGGSAIPSASAAASPSAHVANSGAVKREGGVGDHGDDHTPQGGATTKPRTPFSRDGDGGDRANQGSAGNLPSLAKEAAANATAHALNDWRTRVRHDEMHFLEQLIKKKFDTRRVDAVKGRPQWLQRLLNSDRCRAVLFALAEAHPNCLLITIAIQHAWQHGHADEVRALGPAAASYFSIFHELLAYHFRSLIDAGDDEEKRALAADAIKTACCQSLATYLFAQMMLADLAGGGDAGVGGGGSSNSQVRALAVRISQELETTAAAAHGLSTVRKIAPLLCASDADAAATEAAGELLLAAAETRERQEFGGAGGGLPQGILRKFHDMYLGDADAAGATKPSKAPLRHPDLLRSLFDDAFRWAGSGGVVRPESRDACVDLLVLATTVGDDEATTTKAALTETLSTCERAARGQQPNVAALGELVQIPAVAAGVLSWVRSGLGSPDHYRDPVRAKASSAAYLSLAETVAKRSPRFRAEVLDVVTVALKAMGKAQSEELHLAVMDVAVEVVACGVVLPALEVATKSWASLVDPSHLRYFVGEVLEFTAPPFSGDFAGSVLRLLRAAGTRRGMLPSIDAFVSELVGQRMKGGLGPGLGREEGAILDALRGVRR